MIVRAERWSVCRRYGPSSAASSPGETVDDAVAAVRGLADQGLRSTIDHLGENTTDAATAQVNAQAYLTLLDRLATEGLTEVAEVSVKASALGQTIDPAGATEHAHRICEAAEAAGTTVTLDMEDHTTTDATLELVRTLRRTHPKTGCVLQAMLHRTRDDCREMGGRVRLCKGAYNEPASIAVTQRAAIDVAYTECLRTLLKSGAYPMIATHDPAMIREALGYLDLTGQAPDTYEFQMLYGIRTDEQVRLAREGHTVRVYVPFGTDWYAYFLRRLAEKPANLALLVRALGSRA